MREERFRIKNARLFGKKDVTEAIKFLVQIGSRLDGKNDRVAHVLGIQGWDAGLGNNNEIQFHGWKGVTIAEGAGTGFGIRFIRSWLPGFYYLIIRNYIPEVHKIIIQELDNVVVPKNIDHLLRTYPSRGQIIVPNECYMKKHRSEYEWYFK